MKAVVTGAAGFIGSTLVARLLAEGATVVGADAFTTYYDPALKRRNVAEIENEAHRLVQLDLAEADLVPLVEGADVVFHLAAQPGVRPSWGERFADYTTANVVATQRLLDACRTVGTPRFVYASSSSIYGDGVEFPVTEDALARPFSPYGVSKLAGEHLCAAYADNFGLATVSLRLFTVYGPRQRPDMAFHRFIDAALEGRPVTVTGSGDQIRDFTFVDDAVEAFLAAARRDTVPGSSINVAGGSSASVRETLDILDDLLGPLEVVHVQRAPGDVARTGGSIELAAATLHWRPTVGLADGLARQVAWQRERRVP